MFYMAVVTDFSFFFSDVDLCYVSRHLNAPSGSNVTEVMWTRDVRYQCRYQSDIFCSPPAWAAVADAMVPCLCVYAMLATLSVSLTPSLAFPTFNVYQADPKAGGNSSSDTV